MTDDDFLEAIQNNPANAGILEKLNALALPDCWLVSGALFQTIWNLRSGLPPRHGIADYDIFYFDPDISWQAEDAAIAKGRELFAGLDIVIQIRNQARVHLWYEEKFGLPYPPQHRATEGIDRFLTPCAQVGVRPGETGLELYAPSGLDDIEAMIVRPNLGLNYSRERLLQKARRWKAHWPQLSIAV